MKYEMNLRPVFFDKIKDGEKIYEIRLNDEKRKAIKVGDIITFKKEQTSEQLDTQVVDLKHYQTFEEMLKFISVKDIGMAGKSIAEVISVYRQFYSIETESKYGVLAIKVANI